MSHQTKPFGDLDYYIAQWLKSSRRESPNTAQAYKADLRQFFDAAQKPFGQITVTDILEYQASLPDNYAPRTKARKLATVRSFYKFLNNREITNLNLARIETPRIQQQIKREKLLTEKEVKAIIQAAINDQHRLFVRFLYLTAVRVSESLSLRWRDITPLGDGSATAHIIGKGNKYRDVFLPAKLHIDLKLYCYSGDQNALVFASIKNRVQALRIVQGLAKAAKVDKKVSPHSFRHCHLSHALKNGATLAELRDQAGHASISTTSLYLHGTSEQATATRLNVQ